jgi:hypothetical protein
VEVEGLLLILYRTAYGGRAYTTVVVVLNTHCWHARLLVLPGFVGVMFDSTASVLAGDAPIVVRASVVTETSTRT